MVKKKQRIQQQQTIGRKDITRQNGDGINSK